MTRYWRWYNGLKRPWRLFVCVLMCGPALAALSYLTAPVGWRLVGVAITGILLITKVNFDEKPVLTRKKPSGNIQS